MAPLRTKVVADAAAMHGVHAPAGAHAMASSIAIEPMRGGLAIEGADLRPPPRGERTEIGARLDRFAHHGIPGEHIDGGIEDSKRGDVNENATTMSKDVRSVRRKS